MEDRINFNKTMTELAMFLLTIQSFDKSNQCVKFIIWGLLKYFASSKHLKVMLNARLHILKSQDSVSQKYEAKSILLQK